MPCVAMLTLLLLYAIGGAMVAGGIFIVAHRAFPKWVKGALLWPLVLVTRSIATLQGWATVCFGVSILAFSFGPFAPPLAIAGLRALAATTAAAGVGLFAYSTWLSRRPDPGSLPPRS
jgi:hypothetical protein